MESNGLQILKSLHRFGGTEVSRALALLVRVISVVPGPVSKPNGQPCIESPLLSLQGLSSKFYDTIVHSSVKRAAQTKEYAKARQGHEGSLARGSYCLPVHPKSCRKVRPQTNNLYGRNQKNTATPDRQRRRFVLFARPGVFTFQRDDLGEKRKSKSKSNATASFRGCTL